LRWYRAAGVGQVADDAGVHMVSRELERLGLGLLSSAALHAIAGTVAGRHHAVIVHDPLSEEANTLLVALAPADSVKPDLPETPSDPIARLTGVRRAHNPAVSRSRITAAPPATATPASSAMTSDTGDPLVVGSASAYAGGPTTVAGGSGGDGAGVPDLSLPARLGGVEAWACPWPERWNNGLNDGRRVVAHVAVEVDVDGRAVRARVTDDPGYGFGRNARDCALRGRYIPGRGADGQIARAWTKSFLVIFDGALLVAAPEKAFWETSTGQ
jgi:hypothetical protein